MNGSSFINNKCCHGSLAQQRIYFHTQTDETSSGLNYGPPMYQYSQKLISSDSATCDGMFNCHLTKFLPSLMRRQTHYPAYGLTDVHDVPTLGSFTYQSPINESLIHPCVSFNGTFCDQPTPKAFPKPIIYNYNPQPQFTQPRFSNENRFIGEAALDRVNGLNKQNYFRSTKVNKQSENAKTNVKYQDRNKKLDFKINFRDEHRKVNGCFHRDDKSANKTKSDASAPPPKKMWIRHYMTEETKPKSESPSLVVISRPPVQFTPQPVTIDLSKSSSIPLTLTNGMTNSVTIFNIDESQTSLNLSTESSGYVSNSTSSSLNQSVATVDDLELEKNISLLDQRLSTPVQSTFSALPMPPSVSNGRRRTISSNSNSSTLRSPSTVRAGTREVHNKLEKNRRAHLKECFEALKKQLPITPDEKKTSNLSILGAAIRHIQFLKRKEREFEHEMERLAKEKIAAQNRILSLKREFPQWDIDFSKLLAEQTDVNAVKSERTETPNDTMEHISLGYSSASSLSSVTASSPAFSNNPAPLTNSSTNIIGVTSLPGSPGNSLAPLSLTSKPFSDDLSSKVCINPNKLSTNLQSKSNMMAIAAPANGNHNQLSTALNFKAAEVPSSCQTMPLNLHAISSVANIQPTLNGLKNGLKAYNSKEAKNNNSASPILSSVPACITPTQVSSTVSNMKLDPNEPPTKLIKLINGSAILAPMDKDNKMLHSGQLTLQQVVGGGGLVVSPIQLLTSSQGFKVIGQPNGVTTIELSTPHINGHPTGTIQHRSHHLTSQPGNLQKLLMNGNGVSSSSSANISTINIPSLAQHGSNGNRLAPGGAELNLIPANSTSNNAIYRNQGKLAIMKETNNTNRVHLMQSTPTIVVSQPQNINIITSSPQLAGKMMQTSGPQYLSTTSVKPMLVVNHNGNGSPTSTSIDVGKNHN